MQQRLRSVAIASPKKGSCISVSFLEDAGAVLALCLCSIAWLFMCVTEKGDKIESKIAVYRSSCRYIYSLRALHVVDTQSHY